MEIFKNEVLYKRNDKQNLKQEISKILQQEFQKDYEDVKIKDIFLNI